MYEMESDQWASAEAVPASWPPVGSQKAEVVREAAAHMVAQVAPQELS